MGYEGRVAHSPPTPLRRISERCRDLLPLAAAVMVDDGTSYMLDTIKANTPESHPPVGVPDWPYIPGGDGVHLRDEMHRTEVHQEGSAFQAEAGSDKDYAPHVEEGTGLYGPKHAKYLIEPHNPGGVLVFPWHGAVRHFTHVWHPGSPGQHMFLIGGSMTEMSVQEWRSRGDQLLADGMR